MKDWFIRQLKKRTRVYIRPTRMGGYLIGLIFLMFLLSVGYSNNLLLIFTLILFSLNVIWVLQTHFYLQGLKLKLLTVAPGHAQGRTRVGLLWQKSHQDAAHWDLDLEHEKGVVRLGALSGAEERLDGEVVLPYRGHINWKYLKVATSLPFGLYRVWIYFPLNLTSLSYPALIPGISLPPPLPLSREGEGTCERKGDQDFRDLTSYQGEETRRISWKHYAKSGELLIKQGEAEESEYIPVLLKLPADQQLKEKYLSEAATTLVLCHRHQVPFTYQGKTMKGPGMHAELLRECLKELALC